MRSLPLLVLLLVSPARAEDFRLPPGFEISLFADSSLADDIYCLTCDPKGRVVVAGRGYVRILLDEDRDGRADRTLDFAGAPRDGAMGLFWEGDTLFCMGEGGLRCWRDVSGKGRSQAPELLYRFKTGGEHTAHAIRRGPDGWLYVLCGNHTGIGAKHAGTPGSPVRDPIAGCVLRFSPDLKDCEVVADGYRNAYDMDFNLHGELFVFDSDNERCVSLPWYEPTRCYHVIPGGHHGWLSPQRTDTWRRPPSFLDVVAPLAPLERGSPTGVVCYRHRQFPKRYRGGLFLADWTFGRIWFLPLQRSGSSYTTKPEAFLQATGTNGFAPTGLVVHPVTGDLFVSIGGRGTRGAVYRIRFPHGQAGVEPGLTPLPTRSLDWKPGTQDRWLARATGEDLHARRRALGHLLRHRERFPPGAVVGAVRANAFHEDRYLRQAAARLFRTLPEEHQARAEHLPHPWGLLLRGLAYPTVDVHPLLARKELSPGRKLEAVRIMQLALGDVGDPRHKGSVWEGYSARGRGERELPPAVTAAFPSGHADLDRELSRALAMAEVADPRVLREVAGKWTARSDPVEDIHYLIVFSRLKGPRPADLTARAAEALLALDRKIEASNQYRDRNWPLRIAELHKRLAEKDPALNEALLTRAEFGLPGHVVFTRALSSPYRRAAAGRFLEKAGKDPEDNWNGELVGLVGNELSVRCFPRLRALWGEQGLEEEILAELSRHPQETDRARFVLGLTFGRAQTLRRCVEALGKLKPPSPPDFEEVLNLTRALRGLPREKETEALRNRLNVRLHQLTGEKGDVKTWEAWLRRTYPDRADALKEGGEGLSRKRLASVDWSAGDADRGARLFVRARCAACHAGGQRMGPDLRGVAKRFSRDDLFEAIARPSKAVPPRYRTTYLVTAKGQVYQGMIVYEAVDSLILQTGPDQTLRLTNHDLRQRRLTAESLMPAGLLDKFSDRELADLYAYLRELR